MFHVHCLLYCTYTIEIMTNNILACIVCFAIKIQTSAQLNSWWHMLLLLLSYLIDDRKQVRICVYFDSEILLLFTKNWIKLHFFVVNNIDELVFFCFLNFWFLKVSILNQRAHSNYEAFNIVISFGVTFNSIL